ncbi:hypothetical protein [Rhizobium sp. CECT 9324]|uniref:hypothetical protein n=1 Tax=Rhizobium sp. CECT 9324 TaxID=2845820 RepID=UPI001E5501E6|nr:hypothetical protein [Rhizobium sp. CECT 9324]CAH0341932.1 hypothetical protein RHI9324_03640 [Rhizobium sp. CECT 9324]
MPHPSLHVLIAENQYLIAMEVERILTETLACEVTIVPLTRLESELAKAKFDIVILDAAPNDNLNAVRGRMIEEAGAEPVFLSSYDQFLHASTAPNAYPFITKPPQPEALAEAVTRARQRKTSSDSESLLGDS